jgi:quercetin dioxygenase-like cupin family protein
LQWRLLDGERRTIGPGDAILIPPGAWHTILAQPLLGTP